MAMFLADYNGKSFLQFITTISCDLDLYMDTSFQARTGFFGTSWLRVPYLVSWQSLGIVFLELYPIVFSRSWICFWFGQFETNISHGQLPWHANIECQTSKVPAIMCLVRPLVLLSLKHNFEISAKFVPGVQDIVPDVLSRFQETPEFLTE